MIDGLLGFLLVFCLRLGDVPIGTLRTMLMIQGKRLSVFGLAFCESLIWILAASRVLRGDALQNPYKVAGYAVGFATGVIVGMMLENWIAVGSIIARIVSRHRSQEIRAELLDAGFGVTAIEGQGRDGPVLILFVVFPRKRLRGVLRIVESIDPQCAVTHDPVTPALGGFHGMNPREIEPQISHK